ncbi:MAG: Holliday junction branch migration protein RuvA [Planctomycetes bacterium]|nr:Holliday junction branch migration protein RuvA [Planctomycetota bacterium]
MFEYLEGRIADRGPTHVVVDVGGVAFRLAVPLSTQARVAAGGTSRLYTHLHLHEEQVRLFGFATLDEREAFRLLNGVSGIGPVTALAVLSSASVADLQRAIAEEDRAFLRRLKGVGPKTSERILLELKEPFAAMRRSSGAPPPSPQEAAAEDAVLVLVSLSFTRPAAEDAVKLARGSLGAGAPVEALVKEALRHAARPASPPLRR